MKNIFTGFKILFLAIFAVLFAWIAIHFLALFGIFLAFAFPIFWLIAPNQMFCLLCRAEKDGSKCPLCRRKIDKKEGTSPKDLRSALLNGGLILLFSIISIGVVYGESLVLNSFGFESSPKTATFVIPPKGQYRIGEIFPMKIEINNIPQAINTVQADLGFDPDKIEVVNVSTKDSFADIFIQKEINNEGGWTRLTGGLPSPGFNGKDGLFGTIYFRAKAAGIVKIGFLASSMVLANDKKGTNVLKDLPSISYLILPEKITETEEKDQIKLTLEERVLGASTQAGQLHFYDEGSVLGTKTKKTLDVSTKPNLTTTTLSTLGKIDHFILNIWKR